MTEDDYIGYLARSDVGSAIPVGLAARLRRSHFLFLGVRHARVGPAPRPRPDQQRRAFRLSLMGGVVGGASTRAALLARARRRVARAAARAIRRGSCVDARPGSCGGLGVTKCGRFSRIAVQGASRRSQIPTSTRSSSSDASASARCSSRTCSHRGSPCSTARAVSASRRFSPRASFARCVRAPDAVIALRDTWPGSVDDVLHEVVGEGVLPHPRPVRGVLPLPR